MKWIRKIFYKLFKKNKKEDNCYGEKIDDNAVRLFYNEDRTKRILILKKDSSYIYRCDSYYNFDDEEIKYTGAEGYWVCSTGGNGSFFASEELVMNELKNVLENYHEEIIKKDN